jgi:act minimal PKS acyl carrier protein
VCEAGLPARLEPAASGRGEHEVSVRIVGGEETGMRQVSLEDVKQIMRTCAGEEESVDLDGDVGDVPLTDLGYDSLAVMETTSRLEQELGVSLQDNELGDATTINSLVSLVNQRLAI